MIKKIVLVLAGIIIALALIGFLLPRTTHVERSINIDRPASMVYATVNSFVLFPRWSPWQHLDPSMRQSTQGPREGVGAKLVWTGNDKVGTGMQLITASTPNESVASDLSFGNTGTSKTQLTLSAAGAGTNLRWTLNMDMGFGPIGRYFGLMMDSMVGKDLDNGLKNLKALLESMPNADIKDLAVDLIDLQAHPVPAANQTAGKALETTQLGSNDSTADTSLKLQAFAAAHGYAVNGPAFTQVDDDPATTSLTRRTHVYLPVK